MANLVEFGEQSAGGSTYIEENACAISLTSDPSGNCGSANCMREASTNMNDDGRNPSIVDASGTNEQLNSISTNTPPLHQPSQHGRNDNSKKGGGSIRPRGRPGATRKMTAAGEEEGASDHSSPCRSLNSTSNSLSAATSEDSLPRRSYSQTRYNSSPEPGNENEDDLEQLMVLKSKSRKVSIGVQTEYDGDFPPLSALQSLGDDGLPSMPVLFNIPEQQQLQPSSMVSIVPSSASSSDLAASCSTAADGTLQLVIQNFRHMSDTVRGPSKFVQSVPWRIMVMPRQHVVQKKGTQKCLGFFLQCCPDAYSESWSCQASAELRLISQKQGVPNFTRKTNHVYTAKENDWGYSCFMTWADILDEAQGYIRDDKVILEVSVKADPPKNILSHKEFQKKIQDYKRLADMQCQRGLIDKAIECNLQALKFCKDKDSQCKTELEAQKAHLIEMKLKQSIERIEKGNDPSKTEDDAANLSALRHALGANATRTATAKSTTQTQKNSKVATNTTSQKENDSQAAAKLPPNNTTVRSGTPSLPATPRNELTNANNTDSKRNTSPVTVEKRNVDESLRLHQQDLKKSTQQKNCQEFETATGAVADKNNSTSSEGAEASAESSKAHVKNFSLGAISSSSCSSAGDSCKEHLDSKALIALGHFNKALLKMEEFDFLKEKFREEEIELLPDQVRYIQQLSEKDPSRLKRFSAEFELLDNGKRAEAFLDELLNLKLAPKNSEIFSDVDTELDEAGNSDEKRVHKRAIRRDICNSCLKTPELISTAEFGCQTDFARCMPPKVSNAATRVIQLQQLKQQQLQHQQQQLQQQHAQLQLQQQPMQVLQQQDWSNNNSNAHGTVLAPPISLPTRQRKKATAKKSMMQQQQMQQQQQQNQQMQQQQQQLQQQFQQQFNQQQLLQQQQQMQQQFNVVLPKANPRQSVAGGEAGGHGNVMQTSGQDCLNSMQPCFPPSLIGAASNPAAINAAAAAAFGGELKFGSTAPTNLDMSLAALTAELEISGKLQSDASMINQPNAADVGCAPHYIEEWLRYSAHNNFNFNYDSNGKPYISALNDGGGGGNNTLDAATAATTNMVVVDGAMQQPAASMNDVSAALGLMGLDCTNAKKLTQKLAQFLETVENSNNLRDMRSCIDRLAIALGEDGETAYTEEAISVISVGGAGRDSERSFQPYNDDDSQEYGREFGQSEALLTNRLNSVLYQLQLASGLNLTELVGRVENKLKELEGSEKALKTTLSQSKEKEIHLLKQVADLQKNLQAANEKNDKINQQLKDRKNEIKKLEKKAKSEAQVSAENVELHDKVDSLKKELSHLHRQINEEQLKYRRDTQSLADSKKHLQLELNNRYSELQKLNSALEEKAQSLKKSETQLSNERRNNSSSISSLTERAKKAEINLLEHKLEDGLKVLERARDDCQMQMKSLEEQLKRHCLSDEQEVIKKNIREWENKKDEVLGLINQSRNEFNAHINSIKSGGKQLSQLPKLQVPKPPPCPKLHPMPLPPPPPQQPQQRIASPALPPATAIHLQHHHQHQQQTMMGGGSSSGVPPSPLPLERKAITPPSNRARLGVAGVSGSGTTIQEAAALNAVMNSSLPVSSCYAASASSTLSNSANVTPVKSGGGPPPVSMLHFQQFHHQQAQQPSMVSPVINAGPTIAPIGVRPPNYQNGIMHQKSMPMQASAQMQQMSQQYQQQQARQSPASFSASAGMIPSHMAAHHHQQQQMQPQQQQQHSYLPQSQQQQPSSKSTLLTASNNNSSNNSNSNGLFQTWGGWGTDQLNNISELFGQGRSFGPLGSDFGGNSAARAAGENNNLNAGGLNNNGGANNETNVFFP